MIKRKQLPEPHWMAISKVADKAESYLGTKSAGPTLYRLLKHRLQEDLWNLSGECIMHQLKTGPTN